MTDPLDAVIVRYATGRALFARAGTYPFLGAKVLAARWLVPLALVLLVVAAVTHPEATRTALLVALVVAAVWLRRRWRLGRFHRTYVSPTVRAIRVPVGTADITLTVDRGLGRLVARLARPLSPMEQAIRERYGRWVEPVWRVPTDYILTWVGRLYAPLAPVLASVHRWVTVPSEQHGPRIVLSIAAPFVTSEQRSMISAIVKAKIPAGGLIESWDQVGSEVTATWVPRKRPPTAVGLAELERHGVGLPGHVLYLGQGPGNTPVTIDLHADSPHVAVSAGSGAGKSVLAQLVGVQFLRRGGRLVILDRKGSHRWALGLPGVDYCVRPDQMHDALIKAAALADERNVLALYQPEQVEPDYRLLVICEELNGTITQLAEYWADVREKGDPKRSPAIRALGEVAFMGRSAGVHLLAVAQMLSARTLGGGEARENFGIRCLARYSTNAWRMLVPECAQPRTSRTLGRWQIVVAGTAVETQVAYLTFAEARAYARVPGVADGLDSPLTSDVTGDNGATCDMLTLREAVAQGVVPGRWAAARKRLERDPAAPKPVDQRGQTFLYRREDLAAWGAR